MKLKTLLLAISLPLILVECNKPTIDSNHSDSSFISETHTEDSNKDSSSSSTSSSVSGISSEQETSQEDTSEEKTTTLPIGNTTVSGPSSNNVEDIADWVNYDLSSSLPSTFSYIMGNNKKNTCTDFYAESAGGGFKFAQKYYGFQTGYFTPFKKLEIRLKISAVKNNSQKPETDKPVLHIYGYNKANEYIQMDTLEQGIITTSSVGSDIKIYVKNVEVSYLEFRLNAFPYKGSQCYNFGVSQLSIKGWDYE